MNDLWNLTRKFNQTALIIAAYEGYTDIIKLLLSQEGIDINSKDIWNHKIFIIFKSNVFFYKIKYLNDLWNLTQVFNWMALMIAAYEVYTDIVELLLRQEGIDVNSKDIWNQKIINNI